MVADRTKRVVKALGVLLLLVLLTSCTTALAGRTSARLQQESSGAMNLESSPAPGPRITVRATPQYGLAPLLVTLHATVDGVEPSDQGFKCLAQEWDFGDGAVSSEQADCSIATLETDYTVEHVFYGPGTYRASFRLGDRILESQPIVISVRSRY